MSGVHERPVRRPTRIRGFDYAAAGMYFVTICVQHMESRFGVVENGEVRLNAAGEMVARVWQKNIERYSSAALDLFVVMPDPICTRLCFWAPTQVLLTRVYLSRKSSSLLSRR